MYAKRDEDVMELMTTGVSQDNHLFDAKRDQHVQVELSSIVQDTHAFEEEDAADDINRRDSDSGRFTPQEIEICRTGSPSVRFEEILLYAINATTLHVNWCPVLNNPALVGYKIRYAIKDNPSYNEVFVTSGIASYTISGLKPGTEYVVSVCAIDEKDKVLQQCGGASQRTDDDEDARDKRFDAPTFTAVAAILLLLMAIVVPITLLFVRTCRQCDDSSGKANTNSAQIKDLAPGEDSHDTEDTVPGRDPTTQPFTHRHRSRPR